MQHFYRLAILTLASLILASISVSSQVVYKAMVGQLTADPTDSLISDSKIDAGLALALRLANIEYLGLEYQSTKPRVVDEVTVRMAAQQDSCNMVVFAKVQRFVRLVRAEVDVLSGTELSTQRKAIGYASITYARSETELIADPAVLLALQRALIHALPKPPAYDTLEPGLRAHPAELMAVGGFGFVNDSTLKPWLLFKEGMVSAYDLAQTLVTALQTVDTVAMVDIETRDSMYALAGFKLVENNRPMSATEMRVLRGFDVGRALTGSFTRTPQGALLRVSQVDLKADGGYSTINTAEQPVMEDSKNSLREAAAACVRELFGP